MYVYIYSFICFLVCWFCRFCWFGFVMFCFVLFFVLFCFALFCFVLFVWFVLFGVFGWLVGWLVYLVCLFVWLFIGLFWWFVGFVGWLCSFEMVCSFVWFGLFGLLGLFFILFCFLAPYARTTRYEEAFLPWKTKEKKARFARAPHDNLPSCCAEDHSTWTSERGNPSCIGNLYVPALVHSCADEHVLWIKILADKLRREGQRFEKLAQVARNGYWGNIETVEKCQ